MHEGESDNEGDGERTGQRASARVSHGDEERALGGNTDTTT